MSLLSSIKALGIQVADFYTATNEPYEEITRPFLPATLRPLYDREAECFDDLSQFWRYNELLIHRVPMPEPQPLDTGDQCIWHGIYTAMLALKYACKPNEVTGTMVAHALNGMLKHQTFHGEAKPRLIRGYELPSRWEDNASNDSLTGHLAGIYFATKFGPPALKDTYTELLSNMVSFLLDHKLQLVNADGSPTKHGKLIAGVATDPLQFTLVLAILTLGEKWLGDSRAAEAKHEIWGKYGTMTAYPKVSFGAWTNWNDDHRSAIHLAILAEEDKSPRMVERTRWGLERLWKITKKRGNVWVNGLVAYGLHYLPSDMADAMRGQALMLLGEYELDKKRYNTEVINEGKELIGANGVTWKPKTLKYGKQIVSTQPLPLWAMGAQDFFWQRHRYSVNDYVGQTNPSSRHNGGDFLAAYWLNRYLNILKATD